MRKIGYDKPGEKKRRRPQVEQCKQAFLRSDAMTKSHMIPCFSNQTLSVSFIYKLIYKPVNTVYFEAFTRISFAPSKCMTSALRNSFSS